MIINYKMDITPTKEEVLSLYNDANWTNYTNDPDRLIGAFNKSLRVISAWDHDKLVGLIRVIGDGESIIYIQDIIVLKSYQRNGIGKELVQRILDSYRGVRQFVLLTDDSIDTKGFYENIGFTSSDKANVVSFVKFN